MAAASAAPFLSDADVALMAGQRSASTLPRTLRDMFEQLKVLAIEPDHIRTLLAHIARACNARERTDALVMCLFYLVQTPSIPAQTPSAGLLGLVQTYTAMVYSAVTPTLDSLRTEAVCRLCLELCARMLVSDNLSMHRLDDIVPVFVERYRSCGGKGSLLLYDLVPYELDFPLLQDAAKAKAWADVVMAGQQRLGAFQQVGKHTPLDKGNILSIVGGYLAPDVSRRPPVDETDEPKLKKMKLPLYLR